MQSILKDLRYGVRVLARTPAISALAIIALTLGIGLAGTMFSIVYGALIRGLPFDEPGRIMLVERTNPLQDVERMPATIHDWLDWREQQRSFEPLAAFYTGTVNVSGTERAERFDGAFMSSDAFDVLRVKPLLGRTFREGEDQPGAEPVVVLGYGIWQSRFAGDRGILGEVIRVNGRQATVIGVMQQGFRFPLRQEIWIPLGMDPLAHPRGGGTSLIAFGRLRDGTSSDQANVEMNTIARRLADEYPATNEGISTIVMPYTEGFIGTNESALLYTMLGAVFFVLLIACANVANLLLSQAAIRSKEVGIRTALGASRGRVIRQFLAESFILSGAAAVLGIGVAWLGVKLFNDAIVSTNPPFWIDIRVDPPILLFVIGVTLLASVISGLLPAIQASRANVNEILKDESRGSSSFRTGKLTRALIVFEIALSCGLLVGAGLMIKTVVNVGTIDYGFATAGAFTARIGLPEAEYPTAEAHRIAFEEIHRRLDALPGVTASTMTTSLPALGTGRSAIGLPGESYATPRDYPLARRVVTAPGLFETFGVSVLDGRDFGTQDDANGMRVVLVNQSFVRRHFSGESPLGRQLILGNQPDSPRATIVGVVPDMYLGGIENEFPDGFYVPFAQAPARFVSVALRTNSSPLDLTPLVRDAVAGFDSDLPIYWPNTLAGLIEERTWFYRVFGALFTIFGAAALFLAAIGLYAVMASTVNRRTREIGVRMALGARAQDVVRLIFRQGLVQIGVGLILGLALAAGVSQLVANFLFQVEPRDPLVFALVVMVLGTAGAAACFIPARRATLVNPLDALRSE